MQGCELFLFSLPGKYVGSSASRAKCTELHDVPLMDGVWKEVRTQGSRCGAGEEYGCQGLRAEAELMARLSWRLGDE